MWHRQPCARNISGRKKNYLIYLKTGKCMSDNLEKFVWKNRREFDTEEPSSAVWEKIENTLPVKKEAKRFSIKDIYKWSAAAAVVFAALTAIYFTVIRKSSHDGTI